MYYQIIIQKQADKKLRTIREVERERITEKIVMLGKNPEDPRLDVKKLTGEPYYRLRIGNWRVLFDRDNQLRIISIEKIKPRGDIYK